MGTHTHITKNQSKEIHIKWEVDHNIPIHKRIFFYAFFFHFFEIVEVIGQESEAKFKQLFQFDYQRISLSISIKPKLVMTFVLENVIGSKMYLTPHFQFHLMELYGWFGQQYTFESKN